ncbi:MAG TPA: XRE family transcriptional regulator [Pirellulales bacterium]|jgi:Zn-dependent peptidase ImmA (M78 family)
MPSRFNPEMLVIARGARGLSQSDVASGMKWSQGKASKVEHGLIDLSQGEVTRLSDLLRFPADLFYQYDAIRGFGTCCLYHRKRTTTPIRALNQLHDSINVWRIQIRRLLAGVSLPNEVNFPCMDIDEFKEPEVVAQMLRAAWALPRGPIKNLANIVEAAGGIIFDVNLNTPKIDAVSQRAVGMPPIFFLDPTKPADRCRFTLAHEIGHIVMHRTPSPNAEAEADRFAAEFLMPARDIERDLRNLTIPKAATLKLQWRVAMQAVIRRARDLGAISNSAYQSLCVRISQLGYRKNEPNPIQPEFPTALRQLINVYLDSRGYSVAELSETMLCREDEFRELYLHDGPINQLRVIK